MVLHFNWTAPYQFSITKSAYYVILISPNNPSWLLLDEFKKKHPVVGPASFEVILLLLAQNLSFCPVIFDALDGSTVILAAFLTMGVHSYVDLCVNLFREPPMIYECM